MSITGPDYPSVSQSPEAMQNIRSTPIQAYSLESALNDLDNVMGRLAGLAESANNLVMRLDPTGEEPPKPVLHAETQGYLPGIAQRMDAAKDYLMRLERDLEKIKELVP